MKKSFVIIAAALAAMVSCQKNSQVTQPQPKEGIPMTLTVSFDGADSKVAFAQDGSVLKGSWEATESISVVTLDGSGAFANIVNIDNFTSTGAAGRKSATFTGTFTGGESPAFVYVLYPALEEYSTNKYRTPDWSGAGNYVLSDLNLSGGSDSYLDSAFLPTTQASDEDLAHFNNYCVMTGVADISDIKAGTLTATLSHQLCVLKFNLTFDDSLKGKSLDCVSIGSYDSSDNVLNYFPRGGWEYANLIAVPILANGSSYLGANWINCSFAVPASGTATVYLPLLPPDDFAAGDYWDCIVTINGEQRPSIKKTFTSATSFDRGKMYTINLAVN